MLGVDGSLFERALTRRVEASGADEIVLPADVLAELTAQFAEIIERKAGEPFPPGAHGEDVVAGIRLTRDLDELATDFPSCAAQLSAVFATLEAHYADMCDIEVLRDAGATITYRIGLLRLAVDEGRAVRPDLHLGVCGEHGGDPPSIALCHDAGIDYVSCSPLRVPVARLAAAHAALGAPTHAAGA